MPAKDVDAYLTALPAEQRTAVEKLRKLIQATAPKAVEVISYQIPSYKYHGMLVGFAAFKDHYGFYVMEATFLDAYQDELERYETAKSAIRFEYDKPLPVTLVRKMIKARMLENEARAATKTARR